MKKRKLNVNSWRLNKSMSIGFLSGTISSLCCVGPLIIVFFGLGSLSFAFSLSKYKILFFMIGLFFLTLSIYLYIKNQKKCCVNVSTKEILKKEKNFIVISLTTFFAIYLLFIYIIVPISSNYVYKKASQQISQDIYDTTAETTEIVSKQQEFLVLEVEGMSCVGCASGIEAYLSSLKGIIRTKVDYESKKAEIAFDPKQTSEEEILKALSNLPYKFKKLESN